MTLSYTESFTERHIGTNDIERTKMLNAIGVKSMDELIEKTIPDTIRIKNDLELPDAKSEFEYLTHIKTIANKNIVFKSFIGQGYYGTITPGVILRNILENPGWYTQYTPYQAEISQGRLQALLNFQTMVTDLTGMEIANASLLDEGTAAAEAMFMQYALRSNTLASKYFISELVFPQTIDVLYTRAKPLGIELVIGNHDTIEFDDSFFGALIQYPARNGYVINYQPFADKAHEKEVKITVVADLLSLTILTPPSNFGADIVVGSTQRFGIPMGMGGPHAAFFATKEIYKRSMPGRIIGVTQDSAGNYALRMALQTREQHIRREKATSNICTAQALLAIMASMYAVYHGQEGLKKIALKVHGLATILKQGLEKSGYKVIANTYFDTIALQTNESLSHKIKQTFEKELINLHYNAEFISISIDETTSLEDIKQIVTLFANLAGKGLLEYDYIQSTSFQNIIPKALQRQNNFLTHPVFNTHHSEHEMLRYIKSLEKKDLSLCQSMIPLGSCTMKLNATTEMMPISWDNFSQIHPFAPLEQIQGYLQIFSELEQWLGEITGFDAISLQPNSGAQGEYAGLMVIRAYLHDKGEHHRNVTLIPASAHGTNPASAALAGMKIIVVKCDEKGNIDIADLKQKAEEHKNDLACLMVTYPSTHGVFEEGIIEICNIVHQNGGQVYMDGANMNAQVGLTSPATIGADVCHLNLHKTFAIPHGGGGPGVGPIGVARHLAPFLPSHTVVNLKHEKGIHAVSSAPWGSANVLLISHAYIAMMGAKGLKSATENAILNANYIKSRLAPHYPILYTGKNGFCAHELIVDCRTFKAQSIEVTDIAKRLMDYGFHAPTVSFPVAGTLMIEPTESESLHELDRFCDALIAIRTEIEEVLNGVADTNNNVLKNAPHTSLCLINDQWDKPYSREKAAFPLPYVKENKFWVSVGRVNDTLGDRNLICTCPPLEHYE